MLEAARLKGVGQASKVVKFEEIHSLVPPLPQSLCTCTS